MTHLHHNDDKFIVLDAVYLTVRILAYPIFIMPG